MRIYYLEDHHAFDGSWTVSYAQEALQKQTLNVYSTPYIELSAGRSDYLTIFL